MYETKCRGARNCTNELSPAIVLNQRSYWPAQTCCIACEVRRIVLKCFDIFKHLRGSGSIDKIKKFHRDVPWEFLLTAAVGICLSLWLRQIPTAAENPLGIPYYSHIRIEV